MRSTKGCSRVHHQAAAVAMSQTMNQASANSPLTMVESHCQTPMPTRINMNRKARSMSPAPTKPRCADGLPMPFPISPLWV